MRSLSIKKGDVYGALIVIKELPIKIIQSGRKERIFLCKCICGSETEVQLNNLRSGNSKSCGCMRVINSHTPEVIQKSREAHWKRVEDGKCKMWKGDEASYYAKHIYLKKHFGKASRCENPECIYPRHNSKGVYMEKPKRYDWANITGNYTHNKEDYRQLCPSCHKKFDMGLLKINFKH